MEQNALWTKRYRATLRLLEQQNHIFDKPRAGNGRIRFMNRHLQDARTALDGFKKTGAEPNPEEFIRALYKALDAILKYLEELDHRSEA
jgi:hypothetical protein